MAAATRVRTAQKTAFMMGLVGEFESLLDLAMCGYLRSQVQRSEVNEKSRMVLAVVPRSLHVLDGEEDC
jgi:hypothetical protein